MLINIEHVSVHVSSDGLFYTCFFCPTSADGRARLLRGSTGLCNTQILLLMGQLPVYVGACVCVRACFTVCLCTSVRVCVCACA